MQKLWTTRVLVSMILVVCHVQGHGNRPKCGEHAGDANDAYELRTRGRCAFLSVFESSRSPAMHIRNALLFCAARVSRGAHV